jgi:hypothetical protein
VSTRSLHCAPEWCIEELLQRVLERCIEGTRSLRCAHRSGTQRGFSTCCSSYCVHPYSPVLTGVVHEIFAWATISFVAVGIPPLDLSGVNFDAPTGGLQCTSRKCSFLGTSSFGLLGSIYRGCGRDVWACWGLCEANHLYRCLRESSTHICIVEIAICGEL